jgi:glycosyltransferase involved in cell wall biosynthesis
LADSGRLKILISAYACSPYKGSEPGVGWGFVSALARNHDLWVIVEEEKFKGDIERALEENPQLGKSVSFHFIRKKRNRWLRKIWPPSYYWYYRQWHQDAFRLAVSLHQEIRFDLVHQLTMVGFREPGYLWKLPIPFVWGPVGGMGTFPWRFLTSVGAYGAFYYLGYNLLNLWQMRFLNRPRLAARRAGAGLLTATPENQNGALKYWGCPSKVICEVGLPCEPEKEVLARKAGEPLRIIWSGQHIPRKALNLGIKAMSQLSKDVDWELRILGEGSETRRWKQLAERLGVASRCFFLGWQPREQAMEVMRKSHVMLITSLRDLTSTVTIEALAFGLPIISLNHCGFVEIVDDSCGKKISVKTPRDVVENIAHNIERLFKNEPERQRLSKGALQRAKNFMWECKAIELNNIYRLCLKSDRYF